MPTYTATELEAEVQSKLQGAGVDLFRPEYGRLREAWIASRFATGYGNNLTACKIDIADRDEQKDFDFHLVLDDARLPFQIVEVLDKARRRGDEYRNLTEVERKAIESERLRLNSASYAVDRTSCELQRKADKYSDPSGLHVLVYLNVCAHSVPWAALANGVEAAAKNFASVWVVTGEIMCCIKPRSLQVAWVGWKAIDLHGHSGVA